MSCVLLIMQMINSICHELLSPGDSAEYLKSWKNESFF